MKAANSAIAYLLTLIILISVFPLAVEAQKKQSNKELEAEVAKWKQMAEEATARATKAEAMAVQAQKAAEISERKAKIAEGAAIRARYIAQAKAMAIKSIELSADPEQQALVAMQAYKFNTANQGNPFDNDIYNSLRQALVSVKGELVQNLEGGSARVLVSNDKTGDVFSGGANGMILRWTKTETGWKSEKMIDARKNISVFAMAVSPDGSSLAVAEGSSTSSLNHNLIVYDLKNRGSAAKKISGFSKIKCIFYTPQGDHAYVFEEGGKSIRLTDFKTVREVVKLKERINVIALSPDAALLAGGGNSGRLYIWNSLSNFSESVDYEGQAELTTITFAPDRPGISTTGSRRVLIGDSRGRVLIKFVGASMLPRVLTGHAAPVRQLMFNNSENFLLSVADDGTRIWNWHKLTDPPILLKDENKNPLLNAVFSPDDQQVLICTGNDSQRSIKVWPTKMSLMSESLCSHVARNMTKEEWDYFAGMDLPYEHTCGK